MSEKESKPKQQSSGKTPGGAPKPAGARKGAGGAQAPRTPGITVSDGKETPHPKPRMKVRYVSEIVPLMMGEGGNPHSVPRFKKIVVNIGVTDAKDNIQMLDAAREELALITGQWPQIRRSKKSISNYKLRQGMPIGVRVTLRGDRMYEFLDRLISTAIPRIRDFRGIEPRGFDGTGNFNLGLKEQMIFPEINAERVLKQRGMNITFVTNAGRDEAAFELLRNIGMPFKKDSKDAKSPGVRRAGGA